MCVALQDEPKVIRIDLEVKDCVRNLFGIIPKDIKFTDKFMSVLYVY